MSCILPPEILDLIIDHLHDELPALRACCVVSKSWIPRTRSHLFARVAFDTSKPHTELWKKTFPDPPNSPAHLTRELVIHGIPSVDVAGRYMGGWIQIFHNVVHLELSHLNRASLIPFHGIFPAVKSLRLDFSTTDVFDLVCSFPLLEDLALVALYPESDTDGWNIPSASPKLTGSLRLWMSGRTRYATRRLLDLPGGLHFCKIGAMFSYSEAELVAGLVSRCSGTLEYLSLMHCPSNLGIPRIALFDLSDATKLQHLTFSGTRTGSTVRWITTTLKTIKSKNIQSIVIKPTDDLLESVSEGIRQEWHDLDRLLVQLCITHSIRPRVICEVRNEGKVGPGLLPELTKRGMVDLIETVVGGAAEGVGDA